jgi:hypothetical protein
LFSLTPFHSLDGEASKSGRAVAGEMVTPGRDSSGAGLVRG